MTSTAAINDENHFNLEIIFVSFYSCNSGKSLMRKNNNLF